MKNSTKIALLCIITVCIATIIIPVYRKRRDESIIQEETAKMREVLDQYEAIMPTKLAERCEKAGFEIEGRYTVVPHTELEDNSDRALNNDDILLYFYPKVSCEVTLNAQQLTFNSRSDRAKYETLCSLNEFVEDEYYQLLEEYFPQILYDVDVIITKKARITYRDNGCDVSIKNGEHLYEYASLVKDYYVLDGKDHFLRDKESKWYEEPKVTDYSLGNQYRQSTGKGGSASSEKKKEGYQNADDYAEDYAEYYMEDGLDYDDAYDEAWDGWWED